MKMHVPQYADERYAAQREAGFAGLKFAPELEAEYRGAYIPLNAVRLRIAHLLGVASTLAFIVMDMATFKLMPDVGNVVLLAVTVPSLILPVLATWLHDPGEAIQRYIFYCTVLLGGSLVVVVEISRVTNPDFPYEALLLVMMYVYLISGLMFFQATAVGWIVVLLFVPMEMSLASTRPNLIYEVFYMVVANIIGMIGIYILQYDRRRAFLMQSELWLRAVLDPLTGALNRREFRSQLDTAWALAQRQKVTLGLLLVDIDNFKKVNDTHGHPAGDLVLRAVAETLSACALRPLDAVGRYGGDEFIAVWYDVDPNWLEELAADLPKRLAARELPGLAAGIRPIISGGAVRAHPRPGLLPQDAINLADIKLYERKRAGGGSIATAVLSPPASAV